MNEESEYQHPVMAKVAAFHKRHGPESYSDGSCVYYADGAFRDCDPIGVLAEPHPTDTPVNEWMGALCKRKFYRLKVESAIKQFDILNTRLANVCPADPDAELVKLKQLGKEVEHCKALLAKAEEDVANTRWGRQQAEKHLQRQEQEEAMANFQAKRRQLRV